MSHRDRQPGQMANETPLQGWKEVSSYLERDVRTAQRWEKEAGLPIRRHTDRKQGSVYAYPSELGAWRVARESQAVEETPTVFWRRPRVWATAAFAAAALAIIYGPILNPRTPTAEAAEDSLRTEAVWTDVAADTSSRLSPDGKLLTFVDWSSGELWMRNVETESSRVLTNDGDWDQSGSYVETAMVSPDGNKIASAWMNQELGIYELRAGPLPAEGETDNGTAVFQPPTGHSSYVDVRGWLSNSEILFGYVSGLGQDGQLAVADLEQGTTRDLKALRFSDVTIPSPDGRWIAIGQSVDTSGAHDILLVAADASSENIVVQHPADDTPVAWTPDGSHLLFRSSRTTGQSLWSLPVRDGKSVGQPRMVVNDLTPAGQVGMAPSGDLYYLKRAGAREILEARIDFSTGRLLQQPTPIPVSSVGDSRDAVYSPDGRSLAYFCRSTRTCGPIVVRELATGSDLIFALPGLSYPIDLDWSADSSSLLFEARNEAGDSGAYRLTLQDGSVELLFTAQGNGRNFGWMHGDRAVHYRDTWNTRGAHRIYDLASGQEHEILPEGSRAGISLSPDGKRFAVIQDNRREEKLVTISLLDVATEELTQLAQIDRRGQATNPIPLMAAWTPDGETILFWRRHAQSSPRLDLWSLAVEGGEPRQTELSAEHVVRPSTLISVHPDGERIVFSAGDVKHEVWKLSNFLDRISASD